MEFQDQEIGHRAPRHAHGKRGHGTQRLHGHIGGCGRGEQWPPPVFPRILPSATEHKKHYRTLEAEVFFRSAHACWLFQFPNKRKISESCLTLPSVFARVPLHGRDEDATGGNPACGDHCSNPAHNAARGWRGPAPTGAAAKAEKCVLQAVLFCAVWGSQVALCIVQEEPLWQYDLAMLCGWAALAAFYVIHRLFNPLIFHLIISVVAFAGSVPDGMPWRCLIFPAMRAGSLLSPEYYTMILLWRWGRKADASLGWWFRNSQRALGFLGALALLLTMGHTALWRMLSPEYDFGDPLLNAAHIGNVRKISELLEAGADPNRSNSFGTTPLILAASADQAEVAKLLIAHGASPSIKNHAGWTPFLVATDDRKTSVAKVLLDHGAAVNVANQFGWTPLHTAVAGGPPELVRLLLEHGADINQRDEYGWQPIHRALRSRSSRAEPLAIVTILLEHGADPNAPGGRPEPDSCIGGWPIQVGFGPSVNPNRGSTPLEIAESNGFTNIVALLKKYGAKESKERK